MAYAAKLCNPTPFKVELPWHRGVSIHISPFGETELTMQQMDDFRPGKAGSAEVRSVLDYHGLFLRDMDRPYDNQALEALKRSHRAKKIQYDEAVNQLRIQRARAGVPPQEAAFDETLEKLGYKRLDEEVQKLKSAIEKFEKVVGGGPERSVRPQFDPNRTVMVTDPPREFPSVAAMEFFLEQNPDIRAEHEAFKMRQVEKASDFSHQYTSSSSSTMVNTSERNDV